MFNSEFALLKKITSLILLCTGIVHTTHTMEQSSDLMRVMTLWSEDNPIACLLDGKSFSSLTQVCKMFHTICNNIHVQHLAIDFSDAAEHGNKNLIARFIEPLDWLFEPDIKEELDSVSIDDEELDSVSIDDDENKNIKLFKRLVSKKAERYFGDYQLRYLTANERLVRYIFSWKNSVTMGTYPQKSCGMHLNIEECNNDINKLTKIWFLRNSGSTFAELITTMAYGMCTISRLVSERSNHGEGVEKFIIPDSYFDKATKDRPENLLNAFGTHMIFRIALEKNNLAVVSVMLDNPQAFELLSPDVFNQIMRDLFVSNEIKNMTQESLLKNLKNMKKT